MCNRNQIEASKIKDLGVYENKELTNLLLGEFVKGSNANHSSATNELFDKVNDIVKNSSKDDFADYASQSCKDLMIGIKFQGKNIIWSDYDHSVGPWRGRNDYGQCCFFVPHLNMHPLDPEMGTIEMFHERKPTAKHRDSLTVLLDAEQFNYAFIDEEYESPGAGFNLVLLDHRDKPMVSLSSQIINTGTETQVYVKPSLTRTTDEAIAKFSPEERGCFADGEANLTYLPYDKGYRYVMNNCLSDQGIRGKNDANYSIKALNTFFLSYRDYLDM